MHAIRGLRFSIEDDQYVWHDHKNNSVYADVPESEEHANEMALDIMLELDYTPPSLIEALSWLETSRSLRMFVDAQKAEKEHVLHSIFHGPTAKLIEMLLIKHGEIEATRENHLPSLL